MLPIEKRIMDSDTLKDWLEYEASKYGASGKFRMVFPVSESDVLRKHIWLLRLTEYHINTNHRLQSLFCQTILFRMQNRYALHTPPNTCGRGLKIMHVGPVLINGRATLGEDCSIHINTAIVAGGALDEVPSVGNRVCIGVGAVLIGGIHISDDTVIGANAVCTKSVEETGVTVAGVPAKILNKRSGA